MTDCFALLQQPRQPWLDLDQLKEKYQELTLARHPDRALANADRREADRFPYSFAEITEAYRVLADPKLRLQHLLKLTDTDLNAGQAIPQELLDLFPRIGTFVQTTDTLLSRAHATENALARSIIRSEIVAQEKEAEALLEKTRQLYGEATQEIRSRNEKWAEAPQQLVPLFHRFAYLTKWIQQLEERQFQLSSNR